MDRLIAGLDDRVAREGISATLCVFGDHAPSLPTCKPGFGGQATDYAVFRFGGEPVLPRRLDITADALGRELRSTLASTLADRPARTR